jgi:hypothetical protein
LREGFFGLCNVKSVSWGLFHRLNTLWLSECIDGIDEAALDAIARLPGLREFIIHRTKVGALPMSLLDKIHNDLWVFGLVECPGALSLTFPALRCVFIQTQQEFEFIKKRRWDVKSLFRINGPQEQPF